MSNVVFVFDTLVSESIVYDAAAVQIAVLRRHWLCTIKTAGGGPVTFADVAASIDADLNVALTACMYNGAQYRGTRVRRAFPVNLDGWELSTAGADAGNAGSIGLPSQAAGLISFFGSVYGKKGQGRQYVPFPSQDDNVGLGIPTAGYLTRLDALAGVWAAQRLVTVAGQTATLEPGASSKPEAQFSIITGSKVGTAWATQKRRGGYGKVNRPPF